MTVAWKNQTGKADYGTPYAFSGTPDQAYWLRRHVDAFQEYSMNQGTRFHPRLLAVLLPALLAGCGGGAYQQPYSRDDDAYRRQPPSQVHRYTAADAQDQDTAERVRRVLASDPRIGAETLIVKVVDGDVELAGNAKSPEAANLAARMAQRVPGVRSVISTMNIR